MSEARRLRRQQQSQGQPHINKLATLLGDFYDFLSKTPQPSDAEVKECFTKSNNEWVGYCESNKLKNLNHLFVLNVQEAWKRHTVQNTNGSKMIGS